MRFGGRSMPNNVGCKSFNAQNDDIEGAKSSIIISSLIPELHADLVSVMYSRIENGSALITMSILAKISTSLLALYTRFKTELVWNSEIVTVVYTDLEGKKIALLTAILNFVVSKFNNDVDISANLDIVIKAEPFSILEYMTDTRSAWSSGISDEIMIELFAPSVIDCAI